MNNIINVFSAHSSTDNKTYFLKLKCFFAVYSLIIYENRTKNSHAWESPLRA